MDHVHAIFGSFYVLKKAASIVEQDTRHTHIKVETGGDSRQVIHMIYGKPRSRLTCVGDRSKGHDCYL